MDIDKLREEINSADDAIAAAFVKRMKAAEKIAEYKIKTGKPVFDEKREADIIARLTAKPENEPEALTELYEKIFEISRQRQQKIISAKGEIK